MDDPVSDLDEAAEKGGDTDVEIADEEEEVPAARLCVDIATTLPSGATDDEVRQACIDNTLCRWKRGPGAAGKGKCMRDMKS